jgi:hypothetical protein
VRRIEESVGRWVKRYKEVGRERIQKGGKTSREERPMILTPKRQDLTKNKIKHAFL